MKYDDILYHLGAFGCYQKRVFYVLCIAHIFGAFQALSVIFILDIPLHRCSLGENDTYQIQDEHHAHLVNMSIPWETYRGKPVLSSCYMYQNPNYTSSLANETSRCDSWVFDKSTYESTLTEKFSIVCDDRILRSDSNMASFVGQTLGTLFVGPLADTFGRRPVFLINTMVFVVSCISTSFVPNIYVFMVLRVIVNLTCSGMITTAFVLVMELCGASRRVFVGMVYQVFWCLGLFALGFIAYFLRSWQTLQLTISLPMILYIVVSWLVPESPRWLISNRRIPEARARIQKMASVNKVKLPQDIFENVHIEANTKNVKVTKWLKSSSLLMRTIIIFFNWFVISMVYYGLGLNVQNLTGDIYLNFTIANIVELASYIVCMFLLDRTGRKKLHCFCMLVGGLACVATIFPVLYGTPAIDWVTVLLSMVGKFGVSGAFGIIYVYTTELFPTVIRNSGVGISSFWARIGGLVSPYVADLGVIFGGDLKVTLPLIVFGAFTIAAGLLALVLPETLGKKLPETIEDSKNIKKSDVNDFDNACKQRSERDMVKFTDWETVDDEF